MSCCSMVSLYLARPSENFEYFGFYSMAAIVRQAARFELIRFLNATERRFLSSDVTSGPFWSRTKARY